MMNLCFSLYENKFSTVYNITHQAKAFRLLRKSGADAQLANKRKNIKSSLPTLN